MMWLNIPALLVIINVVCMLGIVVFAYYYEIGCDPLASKQISNPNQVGKPFTEKQIGEVKYKL